MPAGAPASHSKSMAAMSPRRPREEEGRRCKVMRRQSPTSRSEQVVDCLYAPERRDCEYTCCFCEENVWQLCKHPSMQMHSSYAVFVSMCSEAEDKYVPVRQQMASNLEDGLVKWDYHVICVSRCVVENIDSPERFRVFDLDSRMPWGASLEEYVHETFPPGLQRRRAKDQPRFRVVPAHEFLQTFASDRSHMRCKNGSWSEPPPRYDPICGQRADCSHNLDRFRDVDPDDLEELARGKARGKEELVKAVGAGDFGATLSLPELLALFGCAAGVAKKWRQARWRVRSARSDSPARWPF